MINGSVQGCCGNVSSDDTIVPPIASGDQPTYTIDGVSTSCQPCTPAQEVCDVNRRSIEATQPTWHHVRVSLKKHIKLVRDQNLDLQITRRHPAMPGFTTGWGCDQDTYPGEGSNGHVFMRIAAVVRLS